MGYLTDSDLQKILQNSQVVDEIVGRLTNDSGVLSNLADDLADALEEAIKNDSGLRTKILSSLSANGTFRRRVAEELSKAIV